MSQADGELGSLSQVSSRSANISTASKAAGFAVLLRLFFVAFPDINLVRIEGLGRVPSWALVLAVISAITMILGNLTALQQDNFKRLLAYSGISHAGYMLLAILSLLSNSSSALLFYGTSYVLATLGAFAVAIPVFSAMKYESISAFNGLGKKNPFMAAMLTMSMLSLAGIPPLAGFLGKYYIFSEAINNGYFWLTIIAVLASIVGVYYYFKVILAMYTKDADDVPVKAPPLYLIVMVLCVLLSLVLGVFPGGLMQLL